MFLNFQIENVRLIFNIYPYDMRIGLGSIGFRRKMANRKFMFSWLYYLDFDRTLFVRVNLELDKLINLNYSVS